jgi:serine/threonine-protein kinase HipA
VNSGQIQVHLDEDGRTRRAGTAFVTRGRNALSTTFTYDPDYLAVERAPAIDPHLPLTGGAQHTTGLPGAFGDGAPDRWGRNLIDRRERAAARIEGRRARRLDELDYLLGVSDHTRQGALRYRVDDGPFLAEDTTVPKLISLPELLHAADHAVADPDDAAAVKALLDAGTGSLGGARPKAAVRLEDGGLGIAKFPHAHDEWDVMGWEATMLDLAASAGLPVPERRLTRVDGRHVLLLRRFDREADGRRHAYISAMSLLGAEDGAESDYIEVGESLADASSALRADRADLFDRVAFSVAVHNTDDHLRNLGILDSGRGWRLAPVFDVNPNPNSSADRRTAIAGATSIEDEADGLRALGDDLGLRLDRAAERVERIAEAASSWRDRARITGVPEREHATLGGVIEAGVATLRTVRAALRR